MPDHDPPIPPTPGPAPPTSEDSAFGLRVMRYLEGALAPEELDAFNRELAGDAGRRDRFVRMCIIHSAATEELATEYSILRAHLPHKGAKKPADTADPIPEPASVPIPSPWRRWAIAAAIALALIPTALYLTRPSPVLPPPPMVERPPEPFATIASQLTATWGDASPEGAHLPNNQPLELISGFVEIRFTSGATLLINAPARFTIPSASTVRLAAGTLTAKKEGGGFTVETPTAHIIDLGTEFGVSTQGTDRAGDGGTSIAVFSGRIEARALQPNAAPVPPQILEQGQAATVTHEAVTVQADASLAWAQLFPRKLSPDVRRLDVADLLAGGDGTTQRRYAAIDLRTGAFGTKLTPAVYQGDRQFHPVPDLPILDGVFIPNGEMPTSSAGHIFAFPKSNNESYNHLWVVGRTGNAQTAPDGGPVIPWIKEDNRKMSPVLAKTDYSAPGHCLLEFHSNKAVTLDLLALRRMYPGISLAAFQCLIGNSFPTTHAGKATISKADVFVLVDGQPRYERRGLSNSDAPHTVNVALTPTDRFLTLATLDGGDDHNGDWILWADPVLTLGPTDRAP